MTLYDKRPLIFIHEKVIFTYIEYSLTLAMLTYKNIAQLVGL